MTARRAHQIQRVVREKRAATKKWRYWQAKAQNLKLCLNLCLKELRRET